MSREQHPSNPIPTSWISMDDLIHSRPDLAEQIKALPQTEIEYIAKKVGDALQETYWLAIVVVLEDFLNGEAQTPETGSEGQG